MNKKLDNKGKKRKDMKAIDSAKEDQIVKALVRISLRRN